MILEILDIVIPRFVTDVIAFKQAGDYLIVVGNTRELKGNEDIDVLLTINAFNFFGYALLPRIVKEVELR